MKAWLEIQLRGSRGGRASHGWKRAQGRLNRKKNMCA
jgi:hypothetical protein